MLTTFTKFPISALISYTVFNWLLFKRCNIYLALTLTLFHKFHSIFPGNFPGKAKSTQRYRNKTN
jgi:hypothetical protein